MIVREIHLAGVTGRFADDCYSTATPEEIARRKAVFERTVRETVRQIQREQAARQTKTG